MSEDNPSKEEHANEFCYLREFASLIISTNRSAFFEIEKIRLLVISSNKYGLICIYVLGTIKSIILIWYYIVCILLLSLIEISKQAWVEIEDIGFGLNWKEKVLECKCIGLISSMH